MDLLFQLEVTGFQAAATIRENRIKTTSQLKSRRKRLEHTARESVFNTGTSWAVARQKDRDSCHKHVSIQQLKAAFLLRPPLKPNVCTNIKTYCVHICYLSFSLKLIL